MLPSAASWERLKRAIDLKRENKKARPGGVQIIIQATREVEAGKFPKQFSPS